MHPLPRLRRASFAVVACCVAACGATGPSVADERAAAVRAEAEAAGLPADVVDFLDLASRGIDAEYVAEYDGPDPGTTIVVTNAPPNRRLDIFDADVLVSSTIVTGGASFECAGTPLTCTRADGFVEPPGVFTEAGLEAAVTSLASRLDDFDVELVAASLLGIEARCLRSVPRDPAADTAADELCLSREGVVVRAVQGSERLVATAYGTSVPDGIFDLPG